MCISNVLSIRLQNKYQGTKHETRNLKPKALNTMLQSAVFKYACIGASYGIGRGIVKTHNAKIREYDHDMKKYSRPLMVTERIGAITYSAALSMLWSPVLLCHDLYELERNWRGYDAYKDSDAHSIIGVIW